MKNFFDFVDVIWDFIDGASKSSKNEDYNISEETEDIEDFLFGEDDYE